MKGGRQHVIKAVQQKDKPRVLKVQQEMETHYEGPIPSPPTLAAFNEIIPNGADRIMRMAENDQAHKALICTSLDLI